MIALGIFRYITICYTDYLLRLSCANTSTALERYRSIQVYLFLPIPYACARLTSDLIHSFRKKKSIWPNAHSTHREYSVFRETNITGMQKQSGKYPRQLDAWFVCSRRTLEWKWASGKGKKKRKGSIEKKKKKKKEMASCIFHTLFDRCLEFK